MKIRVKIILLIAVVGIFPAIIFGVFFANLSKREIQSKVSVMSEAATKQIVNALNDRILSLEKILNMSVQNEVILDSLDRLPKLDPVTRLFEENKIAKHFNSVAYNNNFIRSIILIPNEYEMQIYGAGISQTDLSEEIQYFKTDDFMSHPEYLPEANDIKWLLLDTGTKMQICVVKNFSYFLYSKHMGTIVFLVDPTIFQDYMIQEENSIISYMTNEEGMNMHTLKEATLPEQFEHTLASKSINVLTNGWRYYLMIPDKYLFGEILQMRDNTLILTGIISAILVLIGLYISFTISNRLKIMINKFKRLETGDFTIDQRLHGKDEFHVIECRYNEMVSRLKGTIDNNYIYQLEKREAELRALQYQINPHFLYNSLEIINAMASLKKYSEIKEVTSCLGKLFRYNMSSTQDGLVYIEEELGHIKNYLYLYNIQLSGRLNLFIDAKADTRSIRILKFLMQPIVENCMKHGFGNETGDCEIEIRITQDSEKTIQIRIIDHGEGMDSMQLTKLIRMLTGDKTEEEDYGIGIKNVNDRIKLFYGPEYGVFIESEIGKGTTVAMILPGKE